MLAGLELAELEVAGLELTELELAGLELAGLELAGLEFCLQVPAEKHWPGLEVDRLR